MISEFRGRYFFLSNFYASPVAFEGLVYPTAEHAFQAAKTLDAAARREFLFLATPSMAKRQGRQVSLRPDWEAVKVQVMAQILEAKFSDPALARLLVGTGGQDLVEGNTWGDRFWGRVNNKGRNQLGVLLMELRERLSPLYPDEPREPDELTLDQFFG